MNFLNLIIGTGLAFMGIYTMTISGWDWISISIGILQIVVGIYLFWTSIRRQPVMPIPMPGGYYG